ncbi:MAG: 2-C-methyl-D-erythritol 4-phosphate cytidylyltransferase [Candidatus Dormibacteraeota bacterium]|nr:2-C-methyl-D-erythritol 4-phosphate cytidylyltransferase [Candidatus Dormibacteraeota bacterium]
MNAAAVVVAGGRGTRMNAGVNKVFLELAGRSILEWSLDLFEHSPQVGLVVVVAQPADIDTCQRLRARYPKVDRVVPGGDVRHRSEFAGVAALAAHIDTGKVEVVLVHDAVRPFATPLLVDRLLTGMAGAHGCVPGLPVPPGTVVVEGGLVASIPTGLWSVQTPQAIDATWVLEAHNKAARAGFLGTDTASVIEWAGGDVRVIEGEGDNIKITTPDDLARARTIAGRR